MKTMLTICTSALAVLALTVACSSKTKVADESQVADPGTYAATPETSVDTVSIPVPENPAPTIPDETAKVASLGASSSGRSR